MSVDIDLEAIHVSVLLSTIPELNSENWFEWSMQMKMFFRGCGAPDIADGKPPTTKRAEFDVLNTKLMSVIYTKVSKPYRYLLRGETTAIGAYEKLQVHFKTPSFAFAYRTAAQQALYNTIHIPDEPIVKYIGDLYDAREKLEACGCTITDREFIDIVLMNLDKSYHSVLVAILTLGEDVPLEKVLEVLVSASVFQVRNNNARCGRDRTRLPLNEQTLIDEEGYRWCDLTDECEFRACNRCGRKGHKAAHCMHNMPQSVKDWILFTSR